MSRKSAKKKKPVDLRIAPTAEAQAHASYESAGMAYRRTPAIDTLYARKQIAEHEYRALAFYRDQASLAERSGTKSCLDIRVGGGSSDIAAPAVITSALLTTARIERDLGALAPIARAVAVDDKSLSQWCVDRFGGRERYDGKGKFIAVVPVGEEKAKRLALMELKMAAQRIVA